MMYVLVALGFFLLGTLWGWVAISLLMRRDMAVGTVVVKGNTYSLILEDDPEDIPEILKTKNKLVFFVQRTPEG